MTYRDDHCGITANGRFVHLRETPQGNLDVVLSERGRVDFALIETIHSQFGNRPALLALLADHLLRGWELVQPRDLGTPALGPILSREIERSDTGSIIATGRIYWYPDFPIYDEIDELHRQGFLELRGTN